MYWVQDKYRTRKHYDFDASTTETEFMILLQITYERHESRKIQRTTSLSLLSGSFTVPLESRHQWNRWSRELYDTLSSIVGASGVPLSYVTRGNEVPILIGYANWEEKVIVASPLTGCDFEQDAKTVHNINSKEFV